MKTLITTAELILAVRTHFAIAENVDITFSHVAGHEGLVAIADTAPTFGDAVEEVKSIATETKATRTRRPPVKAEAADEDDVKPATTKRTFGKKKVEEPVDEADDTDADVDQEEVEEVEQPKATTKKRSFGKKAAAPVEDEDDQEDGEADEQEVEEEKPATKKRSFGTKKKPVVQEDEDEDEGQDEADSDEEGEVEEKPAKRTFGARKTVFGKK